MGSFEKLGILVIVVIIVMILAVAIHQWEGERLPALTVPTQPAPPPSDIRLDDLIDGPRDAGEVWPDGTPRRYTIRSGDKVWVLVVKRWGLKESFIEAIRKVNPERNMLRLQVGDELVIPDPSGYRRKASAKKEGAAPSGNASSARLVRYEIQEGDMLQSIAAKFLGSRHDWRKILEANPGLKPEKLRPGNVILIPLP